jgi:hypothetical protein
MASAIRLCRRQPPLGFGFSELSPSSKGEVSSRGICSEPLWCAKSWELIWPSFSDSESKVDSSCARRDEARVSTWAELEVRDLGGVEGGVVVSPDRMLRLFIAVRMPWK